VSSRFIFLHIGLTILHFLWRVATNSLPMRTKLKLRGLDVDTKCPLCLRFDEDGGHVNFWRRGIQKFLNLIRGLLGGKIIGSGSVMCVCVLKIVPTCQFDKQYRLLRRAGPVAGAGGRQRRQSSTAWPWSLSAWWVRGPGVGVEVAPAWACGKPRPSGRGRCVASGPDLGLDGPEQAAAPVCDDGVGDDVFAVAAVVVMPASRGVLLQVHAGWW
jgi:hypothetical protein